MLTSTNYTVWAIKVEAILDAQGVWEAVSPGDGVEVDETKNKMARAQLLGALSEDILMQVSTKKTAKEVWDSLKTRFVGANRVKAARLSTLRGEFDRMYMAEEEQLDDYAGKISGKFCDMETMAFEEALGRLKAFEERSRRRAQAGRERSDGQLLLTAEQWEARRRQSGGGHDHGDNERSNVASGVRRRGKCHNCGVRGHFARDCRKLKE
ncbi:unnamed protein product [Alopecurus aequalis]